MSDRIQLSDGTGHINRHADFASRYVAPRHVDVWCPSGVAAPSATRYPVIYMHDGQNLFDPALSFIGVDWGMDEAMTRLRRRSAMIVAALIRHVGAHTVIREREPPRIQIVVDATAGAAHPMVVQSAIDIARHRHSQNGRQPIVPRSRDKQT